MKTRQPRPRRRSAADAEMLPYSWKTVTLWTVCLIVIVVMIGLIYNP